MGLRVSIRSTVYGLLGFLLSSRPARGFRSWPAWLVATRHTSHATHHTSSLCKHAPSQLHTLSCCATELSWVPLHCFPLRTPAQQERRRARATASSDRRSRLHARTPSSHRWGPSSGCSSRLAVPAAHAFSASPQKRASQVHGRSAITLAWGGNHRRHACKAAAATASDRETVQLKWHGATAYGCRWAGCRICSYCRAGWVRPAAPTQRTSTGPHSLQHS